MASILRISPRPPCIPYMKKQRKLLDRSLNWIRDHLHATNLDVPDEFVTEWIFEDEEDEPRPAGFYFSVFAFGYLQHDLLTGPLAASTPRSVPMARLVQHFYTWQMKLALVEIHRRTDVQVEPMPLFGFPEGEQVRCWPRQGEMAPPAEVSSAN